MSSPFRLCFRLEEPAKAVESQVGTQGKDDTWSVRYLLQASDDKSLLISLKEAWQAKGQKASLLKRHGFNLREYLFVALFRAGQIYRPMGESLQASLPDGCSLQSFHDKRLIGYLLHLPEASLPDGCSLSTAGAYEFLT